MEKGKIIDWVKNNVSTWIDEQTINTLNNDKLIECINKCTSPRKSKLNEQINEDDLKLIFNAFSLFKPEDTRVLIIGQDPYPSKGRNEGRAHGLAFSFGPNSKNKEPEDSILNIFKAIKVYKEDMQRNFCDIKKEDVESWNTNLKEWASKNKVLLLNTALTYKKEENHFKIWNNFIKQIIKELIEKKPKNHKLAVFLWGQEARKIFYNAIKEKCPKSRQIQDYPNNTTNIKIYITGHPTPSYNIVNRYGFSKDAPKHFAACDEFLDKGKKEKDKLNTWLKFPEDNEPEKK